MKRTVTKSRINLGRTIDEGNKAMSIYVYEALYEILFKREGQDSTFAHCFLVLDWDLTARSENCLGMDVSRFH